MPLSLMSAPAIAQGPTPPPTTAPTPTTPPSAPATPTGKALAQAKKDNRRIEIESLRSESATYYANPDGKTLRMELYLEPVRVKNANGDGFTPIDTTLVEADGVIRPKAAKGSLLLSAGGNTEAIKSKSGDIAARIDAPRTLPKPTLNGSTATYASVYGKGIDLVVTATATGFRQQIVIRERPAGPVTFHVPVDLPKGISFGKNAKGQPALKSDNGKHSLDIRPAALLDAAAADANADLGAIRIGRAQVSLDGSALVYSPDAAFLADPATTYPVTMAAVDDDWYECTLGGDPCPAGDPMDTYINDVDLTDSWDMHYRDQMWVGKSYASSIAKRWRAYIQFPLPGSSDPFWGSRIQNADLELWNYLSNDCGLFVGSGITARRVTSDWDHLTLQWGGQPSVTSAGADTEYGAYSPDCSGSMNYEHDLIHYVNPIVQAWADGEPNYGFQLTAGDESELRNWRRYRSREQTSGYPAHGPRLKVDFEPPPVRYVVMQDPREPRVRTQAALDAYIAKGRIANSEPQPAAVTYAELQEARENAVNDSAIPEEDLQSPMKPPAENATARWSFTEGSGSTAADTSGQHNATVQPGVEWVPGVSNSALSNVSGGTAPPSGATQQDVRGRLEASKQAAAEGTKVEVPAETTEDRITYAQPEGSFVTEVTAGPVRTKQGDNWVPIDTDLTSRGGVLQPKAIAEGATVEISTGGTGAFAKLVNRHGQSYALQWPTALPSPTVKANKATFADAAGKGSDLVVTVLPTGFLHEVHLRERPSKPLEIRIGVETSGLILSENKDSRLLLKNPAKEIIATGARPMMWDGSGKGLTHGVKRAKIDAEVVTKKGYAEVSLKPDHGFLTSPSTVYPVSLTPATVMPLQHDVEVDLASTADAPAYPSGMFVTAGTRTASEKSRVHLLFDTLGLPGSTVTDAKLSLLNVDAPSCGPAVGAGIQARRLTAAWDPNNLYWANMPASTTEDAQTNTAAINQSCPTWPGAMEWNVTGMAQDWAAGAANHGIVLQSPNESVNGNYRIFPASEETLDFNNPPKLTITTSGASSAPTVSGLAITPAQSAGGTTVTTSLTPQLAATVADTIGGNLTGEFEIEHDPAAAGQGTGQIWAGASNAVVSASQAAVSVPAGKLTDGWKIRWRARAVNTAASTASAWSDWQNVTVDLPDPQPNPTVGALQIAPSRQVDGKTVTTSLIPSLLAQVTDPTGGALRAEFELDHDPAATGQGTGQIWAGAVDNIASGSQATVAVPDGKLTDGWKIRWRARAVSSTLASAWSEWQYAAIRLPQPVTGPLAKTAGPVIRTDQSFTVAAWVKWEDKDGEYTIIEQSGTNSSAFRLGNDPDKGLIFTFTSADSATASIEGVLSSEETPVNQWFHVAATYDSSTRIAILYLNGNVIGMPELDESAEVDDRTIGTPISFASWNAAGPMTLGTSMDGAIDEIWAYTRALLPEEVWALYDGSRAEQQTSSASARSGSMQTMADPMKYDRVTPQQCWDYYNDRGWLDSVTHEREYYIKSHFSGCMIHKFYIAQPEFDHDLFDGYLIAVANTTNGMDGRNAAAGETSRDVYFDIYTRDVDSQDDDYLDADFTLSMNPAWGQNSCKHMTTWNGSQQRNYVVKKGRELVDGSDTSGPWNKWATFRFRAAQGDAPATRTNQNGQVVSNVEDAISSCNFHPWIKIDEPLHPLNWRYGNPEYSFNARCDSAPYISSQFKGGCTLDAVGSMVMTLDNNYDVAFLHLWKACYQKADTYPNKASKTIRGCPGANGLRPPPGMQLHRIGEPFITRSRNRATTRCRSLWPGYGTATPKPQDCDEFPFASSAERTAASDKSRDLSVCAMDGGAEGDNQQAGGELLRFYDRDRILREDPYFVRFKTTPENVPTMDNLCWKPAVGPYTNP
ncbi:DNRLRE domain-containing protein [Nonomuraea sp. NPDC003804]|uniref:DNRLRE domain-containing protein n=1 Tax=Nonomuraea sp. NPDC003804 TaxID=3154547 RepID=UPI00339F5F4D